MKGILVLALTLALASTAASAARKVEEEQGGAGTGVRQPLATSGMSKAETLSCTVALCMANPGGWSGIQECRDPVEEWFERKRRGKSTPPCPGLSSNSSDDGGSGGGGRGQDTRGRQQRK